MNPIIKLTLVLFVLVLPFLLNGKDYPDSQIPKSTSFVFKQLVTPNPTIEAEALYRYLQTISGEKILSGQMCTPQGINETEFIYNVTGKQPALRGTDLMYESSNNSEINKAINWWKQGGISLIMWSWGAPTHGHDYENSRKEINIERCFQEGTAEYKSFWQELDSKANSLEKLRDANVPVLWCPFHEPNNNSFWWGKKGPGQFKKLWQTMFNYFVQERDLNNLIWVQCFSESATSDWFPGDAYVDIIGAGSYDYDTNPHQKMFENAQKIMPEENPPLAYNLCTLIPSVDECRKTGTMWCWWMQRPTSNLEKIEHEYLFETYNHKLVVTLSDVPEIVKDYSTEGLKRVYYSGSILSFSDLKGYNFSSKSGNHTEKDDHLEVAAKGESIDGKKDDGYFIFKQMDGDFDISVQVVSLAPVHLRTLAGIMARVDLSKSSPHAFFRIFPKNSPNNSSTGGCEFSFREKKGKQLQVISPAPQISGGKFKVEFPNTWIRLKRRGNLFKSYISHDDIHWYMYSVHKQEMPEKLLVGLAVSSNNANKNTTAEFKSINVTWE
ncbi:glycosyl hydrolase [Prolixibacteraceae bacterium Z1-6]|uniref:Glycosyl hydrolase n=1 Tax=Draconibacterium aestuarii TaxID=2998507 RepID=A0A9X3J7C7_9BACT|nr:glycosyl hydrolase [Prolixibacteraceae bacterium Z1-6]